ADAQYVLGQAAINDLQIIVENAPEAAQAFQISLAEVRGAKRKRDLGGVRISVPEFDTACLIVLSTDSTLYMRYQELIAQIAPQAARWQKELAELQLAKTEQIDAKIQGDPKDADQVRKWLEDSHEALVESKAALDRHDYRLAIVGGVRGER